MVAGIDYKRNFLAQIIVRVDLATPVEYTASAIEQVTAGVRDFLPTPDTQEIFQMQLTVGPKPTYDQRTIGKVFRFTNREANNTLVLEPSSVILDVRKYLPYSTRRTAIESVVTALRDKADSIAVSRTGIRYITRITMDSGDPFEWSGLINKSLLSSLAFAHNHAEVSRAMGSFNFTKETCDILFQYGLYNSEFPNPIARKEFLLDIDCFTVEPSSFQSISEIVDQLRDEARSLFESCIEDGLRQLMR